MRFLITVVLMVLLSPVLSYAENILNFARVINDTPSEISTRILTQAYKRINIKINFIELPAERSLREANSGLLDGEVHRIMGIDEKYENLIMIPIPINTAEAVIFSKNHNFPVKGWDSLKPYSIGIRMGIKFAENGTEGLDVLKLYSDEKVFMLLSKNRYDVCVSARIIGLYQIQKYNLPGIKALEPPLENIKMYHYLHKNKKDIVPKITAALVEMEREGVILNERKHFIEKLLQQSVKIEQKH